MKILHALQKRTLPKWQLFGAGLTLTIGLFIVGITVQLYSDVSNVFDQDKTVFGEQTQVITKRISARKSRNKDLIYFRPHELEDIRKQDWLKDLAFFDKARFKVQAFTKSGEQIPGFSTDLFFESVPNSYLDIDSSTWHWQEGDEFVPIVVPADYIDLYNFGFAETQGLPVISKSMIEAVRFGLRVSGNGQQAEFRGGIVDFSTEINSILVPQSFLNYANARFAQSEQIGPSRLLIRLHEPSDSRALNYFLEENLNVVGQSTERAKYRLFVQMIFAGLLLISAIVIMLSIASIVLSIQLLLFKEKQMIADLGFLGYSLRQVASFYLKTVSMIILGTSLIAIGLTQLLSTRMKARLNELFDFGASWTGSIVVVLIALLLFILFRFSLRRGLAGIMSKTHS